MAGLDISILLGWDKIAHFSMYAFFAFFIGFLLLLVTSKTTSTPALLYLWFLLSLIGIIEEYRQYFVLDRSAEFLDAIANVLGITAGLFVPFMIAHILSRKIKQPIKVHLVFMLTTLILTPLLVGLLYINENPFIYLPDEKRMIVEDTLAIKHVFKPFQ